MILLPRRSFDQGTGREARQVIPLAASLTRNFETMVGRRDLEMFLYNKKVHKDHLPHPHFMIFDRKIRQPQVK